MRARQQGAMRARQRGEAAAAEHVGAWLRDDAERQRAMPPCCSVVSLRS